MFFKLVDLVFPLIQLLLKDLLLKLKPFLHFFNELVLGLYVLVAYRVAPLVLAQQLVICCVVVVHVLKGIDG